MKEQARGGKLGTSKSGENHVSSLVVIRIRFVETLAGPPKYPGRSYRSFADDPSSPVASIRALSCLIRLHNTQLHGTLSSYA